MAENGETSKVARQYERLVRWLGIPAFFSAAWLLIIGVLFLLWFFHWYTPHWTIVIYMALTLVMSTVEFIAYWRDKRAAEKGRERTPERRLFIYAALGGWPGAIIAARLLRHKSSKRTYRWKMTVISLAHVLGVVAVLVANLSR